MYCTTAEVLGKIRDDMIDAILGSDLIEDEQEREDHCLHRGSHL